MDSKTLRHRNFASRNIQILSLLVLLTAFSCLSSARAQLRVGAGRVNITPATSSLPSQFHSVHDPIFTRAILLENGRDSLLLINADVILISSDFFDKLVPELEQVTGVPASNIMLSATHDHSSPFATFKASGPNSAKSLAFSQLAEKGIIEAAKEAKTNLQVAEVGFGTGDLYINVNRDAVDPKTRRWAQEANLNYPSDKTLAVIEFRKPSGEPIAVYMNYAMHAISMFLRGDLSGDVPGAAERYVEDVYDNKVVAMWTSGAAGDQNPLYLRQNSSIIATAIQGERDPSKPDDEEQTEATAALFRLMVGNAQRPPATQDPKALERSSRMMESMGQTMAERALIILSTISSFDSHPVLSGVARTITCPGRRRLDHGREGTEGKYEDSDPVKLSIGAVRIGELSLGWADAELYNMIGQEVKQNSPSGKTIMASLTNGQANSGYVPTDDAFARYSFEVVGSSLKPGCAEKSIVDGVTQIMAHEHTQQ